MSRSPKAATIIVAAGAGSRLAADRPKQFVEIGGKPLLAHTVSRFRNHPLVSRLVLVLPSIDFEGHARFMAGWLEGDDTISMVPGGTTRQDSVWEGLGALPSGYEGLVAVHDGARPLVSAQLIGEVIEAAAAADGAVPGVPVVETLKEVGDDLWVLATIDRGQLYHAQTPQCFWYRALREAIEKANAEGFVGTDEAAVLERAGARIRLVPGSPTNIKVTTRGDLALAEWHLSRESL